MESLPVELIIYIFKNLSYGELARCSVVCKQWYAIVHNNNDLAFSKAAIAAEPANAEYHRLLGTLCGQVIPADPLAGFQHGKCAKQEIEKALALDPKSALAWVSSGVGKYYLPPMLGGGLDLALKDFEKATALNPKLAEAWLWIGLTHRKAGRNPQARQALEKAQSLNPQRVWIKQQLEKTPAS